MKTYPTPAELEILQYISRPSKKSPDLINIEGHIDREIYDSIVKAVSNHKRLLDAVRQTLQAIKKYPDHPLTASELILREALYTVELGS